MRFLGRAHRPGRKTSQTILFSTTVLCLRPRLESSTIVGAAERLAISLKFPPKFPVERHFSSL
jgi:hypothetical protein